MICRRLDEGEQFWCAGNVYTMLIPRDDTRCFEAVLETVQPGKATPPNAHETFVQMYFVVCGHARVHIGGDVREISRLPLRSCRSAHSITSRTPGMNRSSMFTSAYGREPFRRKTA